MNHPRILFGDMVLVGQGSIARRQTNRIDTILYADRNTGECQRSFKGTRFDHLRQIGECPNLRLERSSPMDKITG